MSCCRCAVHRGALAPHQCTSASAGLLPELVLPSCAVGRSLQALLLLCGPLVFALWYFQTLKRLPTQAVQHATKILPLAGIHGE